MILRLVIGSVLAAVTWVAAPFEVFAQATPELHERKQKADCQNYLRKPTPKFRIAIKTNGDHDPILEIQGSMSPKDFDEDKLIALACDLGNRYAGADLLVVWILDCFQCAKNYAPIDTVTKPNAHLKFGPLRATYTFSRETGAVYNLMRWWPDPMDRKTRVEIDFGSPPAPPETKKKK